MCGLINSRTISLKNNPINNNNNQANLKKINDVKRTLEIVTVKNKDF